jgi:hypothetical protein
MLTIDLNNIVEKSLPKVNYSRDKNLYCQKSNTNAHRLIDNW